MLYKEPLPKLFVLRQQNELIFMVLYVGWAQLGDSSVPHGIGWVTQVTISLVTQLRLEYPRHRNEWQLMPAVFWDAWHFFFHVASHLPGPSA